MRPINTLSVIPGQWFIALDGEGYMCQSFDVPDFVGNTRTIPGNKILAIQWWGEHGHGQVEGFGPGEPFTNVELLSVYVQHWLDAKVIAKSALLAQQTATQAHENESRATMQSAIDDLTAQQAGLRDEVAAASGSGKDAAQARLDNVTRQLEAVTESRGKIVSAADRQAQVDAAQAANDAAVADAAAGP